HKLDVIRLLVLNGIWDYLHPEVRRRLEEKIEKNDGRVWLSVALDAFSRSVCVMTSRLCSSISTISSGRLG
ncbi:hypothetical protein ACDA55_37490, partial [Rhizobium ruizarguesonis]